MPATAAIPNTRINRFMFSLLNGFNHDGNALAAADARSSKTVALSLGT